MEEKDLKGYKTKLLKERKRVRETLNLMKTYETSDFNIEAASELSFYDNHPADNAGCLYDEERGTALKRHEESILAKIDDALDRVDDGSYGICVDCKKEISRERLDFLPYVDRCVKCQRKLTDSDIPQYKNRPVEEKIFNAPFGYGVKDDSTSVEFDAEDSYQSVARFNNEDYPSDEYYDDEEEGYVEPIERISNEQYKNQLPD